MTAQLPQENGNDGKNLLEIGLDDQRQEDRVAAVTRSTRRQLLYLSEVWDWQYVLPCLKF